MEGLLLGGMVPAAAIGQYFLPVDVMGINFYGFRVLVLGLVASCLLRGILLRDNAKPTRAYLLLGSLWTLWGVLGLYWAPDQIPAIKEITGVTVGLFTVLSAVNLGSHTLRGVSLFHKGWVWAYLAVGAVAVWELVTGNHLVSYWSMFASELATTGVVASTFVNPNNYAAFLVISLPVLLSTRTQSGRAMRLLIDALIISVPFLLTATGSRLGIIAVFVELLLYLLLNARRGLKQTIVYLLLGAGVLISLIQFGALDTLASVGMSDVSIEARVNLIGNGLWYLWLSYGMGIGPGGFEGYALRGIGIYPTGGIINPHSLWNEILSQYGLVIFVPFVVWFVKSVVVLLRCRQRSADPSLVNMTIVGASGYVIMASANSSYLEQPMNWVFLAMFVSVVSSVWQEQRTVARGVAEPHQTGNQTSTNGATASPGEDVLENLFPVRNAPAARQEGL